MEQLNRLFNKISLEKLMLLFLCSTVFGHALLYLLRMREPILGFYHFRQTQTAISAYWMKMEGLKVFYETPILGSPWSIPFEFPIFQWVTVFVSYTGLPIDSSARLVSLLFFFLCLYVCSKLLNFYAFSKRFKYLFLGLLCLSPLYLYWSGTSMIESTALFFSLAWLYFYVQILSKLTLKNILLCIAFGTLAGLEKITTLPSFILIAFTLTLFKFYDVLKKEKFNIQDFLISELWKFIILPLTVFIPIYITLMWVQTSDAAKMQNIIGQSITSETLSHWNYGTLEQRLKVDSWINIIISRTFNHTLGYGWIMLPLLSLVFIRDIKAVLLIAVSSIAYLCAPLIFWNLHIVHSYYPYANGIFLIFCAAIVFDRAFDKQKFMTTISLGLFCMLSLFTYKVAFANITFPGKTDHAQQILKTARWVQNNTSPDEGLFVFGIDWSAHVHFYAERKGIAFIDSISYENLDKVLSNPSKFLNGKKLGAIIFCESHNEDYWHDKNIEKSRISRVEKFLETKEEVENIYGCQIFQ